MTATSYNNGNKIVYDFNTKEWHYEDGEKADAERPCPKCGNLPDKNGHDSCIGNLPGVKYACCGHGVHDGYIMFLDGTYIKFNLLEIERKTK